MQYTTPIFIGGLIAWLVGMWSNAGKNSTDDAAAIAEAETSPGTLLASGYIAGGTLAAVAVTFLEFSQTLKEKLDFHKQVSGSFIDTNWFALTIFGLLIAVLIFIGVRYSENKRR
jgi:hypothetical protein